VREVTGSEMSENYKLYAQKIAELRAAREASRTLRRQLEELFEFVRQCEAAWPS
jgi:hypothetical protein